MFNNNNKLLTNRQLLLSLVQHFRAVKEQTTNSNNNNKYKIKVKNNDYLGIFSSNNKEMSGIYGQNRIDLTETNKYSPLLEKRDAKLNDQKLLTTTFGRVRLDSDNRPLFHGQYDEDFNKNKFDLKEFEIKFNNDINSNKIESQSHKQNTDVIEEQNFGEQSHEDKEQSREEQSDAKTHINDDNEYEFIDRQYLSKSANFEPLFKSKIKFKYSKEIIKLREEKVKEEKLSQQMNYKPNIFNRNESIQSNQFNKLESPLKQELFSDSFEFENKRLDESDIESDSHEEEPELQNNETEEIKLEDVKKVEFLTPTAKTGAEYLRDIQTGKASPHFNKLFTEEVKKFGAELNLRGEKLDSKGFRILRGQVFDYNKFTNEDITEMLWNRILFNDADIVAINKPYGMSVHSAKNSKSGPSLTQFLPQLSERLGCEQLYTVHRLDKDTTGILLLVKTQSKAHFMNRMFAEHKISKRYYCITRGVPDDPEGIIDIPIEMGRIDGKERMVLRPEALEEYKSVIKPSNTAKRAVTQYKVISESKNAALLEVFPQTGVRHQIRIHLGFGLRCPVLGDHKYSHIDKIAPQKLTGDMLVALNVRQSKVRHIPMHLHARQYCIPEAGMEGRNIFINAPLPPHFVKNMASLKLRH